MSAVPDPATVRQVGRSPRNATASSALMAGTDATIRLAVPAGTLVSPQFSRSWYALMPQAPTTRMRGRSARRGLRTPRNGATASSASDADASRTKESAAGPYPSRATRMAGNAEAHSSTVAARAREVLSNITDFTLPTLLRRIEKIQLLFLPLSRR